MVVKNTTEEVTFQPTPGGSGDQPREEGSGREAGAGDPGLLAHLAGLLSVLDTPCIAVVIPAVLRAGYYLPLILLLGKGGSERWSDLPKVTPIA